MSKAAKKLGIEQKPLTVLVDKAQNEAIALNKVVIAEALRAQENRINFLETEIKSFDSFHPRAMKLMRKRKNFLVIAEDEPYFLDVYREIRKHEQKSGRWTEEDEIYYLKAKEANI